MIGAVAEGIFWLALGLLGYVLVGYPLLMGCVSLFFCRRDRFGAGFFPSVTVVVPAYNEEDVIEQRLKNLLEQEYPTGKLEVIVVSDGSVDRTDEIVRSFEATGYVRLLRQERAGKTAGLNRAVREARGEIIVLTDANTRFEKTAIVNLVQPLKESRVGCSCGDLRLLSASTSTAGEGGYWSYETLLKKWESRLGMMLMGAGGIYALRRIEWVDVPSDMADDSLLPLSLRMRGKRVVFVGSAKAFESISETVREEFKRRVRMVAQDARLIFYFRGFLQPFRPFLLFQFLSHKWLRWQIGHLMMMILLLNVAALFSGGEKALFVSFLILQAVFYGMTMLGGVFERLEVSCPKLMMAPYYFTAANAAATLGFWRGTLGHSEAVWNRAESTRRRMDNGEV